MFLTEQNEDYLIVIEKHLLFGFLNAFFAQKNNFIYCRERFILLFTGNEEQPKYLNKQNVDNIKKN